MSSLAALKRRARRLAPRPPRAADMALSRALERAALEEFAEGVEATRARRLQGLPDLPERSESFRSLVWRHAAFYGDGERSPDVLTAEIIRRIGERGGAEGLLFLFTADLGDLYREFARAGTPERFVDAAIDPAAKNERLRSLEARDWTGVDLDMVPLICRPTPDPAPEAAS